jgi:hypothetical protein
VSVRGSRLAGDNPDNHYTLIPIDGNGRFELMGRRREPAPGDINFTVMGSTGLSKTQASIEGRDLVVDQRGRFTVSIGPDAADGPRNHMQTRASSIFLFIRKLRSDWKQRPAQLEIRRLDPPKRRIGL